MESVESKNMESNIEKETFNFPTLPYVCQRRFVEICDKQTLKTFSSINKTTQNLSKRCHIIEKIKIDLDAQQCIYSISCFCKANEFCNGDNEHFYLNMKKIEIIKTLKIKNINAKNNHMRLPQILPFTFHSIEDLILNVDVFALDELKLLITPGFKFLAFMGGIQSNSVQEFIDFIKDLSNRGTFEFIFDFILKSSPSTQVPKESFRVLETQKIIDKLSSFAFLIFITKN